MKKIILPLLLCLFAFGSINATTPETLSLKKVVTIKPHYNVSAFLKLIRMGNYEAVKALIERGENINKKSNGLTPLMYAARYNKAEIVKLLIDNGAKLRVKSTRGNMTALDMAKRSKAFDAVKIIKESL
ncbi:ankyrin repeat domain-containing protein [Polaribacter sp. R2A056_3_33]|uniref:ankyrin repeat domain-containing protein n=1 Tax=Polaribacter sp. R2A056_3_33 TaxID=2745563 RepID=UPI001C4F2070|nr:ankyrin repeat domain-containing protein [Polaribacter sp. R2A056_3_33]QXP71306.1 ankyrin repeat domain-containing protein [Polaribacter sp. R2A056_3_33]